MPKYIVTEIQTFEGDTVQVLPSFAFDDELSAEAKYHALLSTAAISKLPKHAVTMMSEEGFPLKHECYLHVTETVTEGEE